MTSYYSNSSSDKSIDNLNSPRLRTFLKVVDATLKNVFLHPYIYIYIYIAKNVREVAWKQRNKASMTSDKQKRMI